MDPTITDENWRTFTDPHGYFHIEIPASWRVEQSDGPFTLPYKDGSWAARSFITSLVPSVQDNSTRRMWITIRIEQYMETPLPMKGFQEPTDSEYLRTYHIVDDTGWLVCTVSRLRVHIQYQIDDIPISRPYKSMGWEPPAPLSPDEQQRRLTLIQRITASFDLLPLD